ncbi:hypothetical protein, partial [Bacillus mycoides]|uniref:hypothetical protein n=2 Tax=Bacillus mycoides TaxID=1405 RepID=UPI002E1F39A3|nr:hypothetical protein [Bacillus mycoides]
LRFLHQNRFTDTSILKPPEIIMIFYAFTKISIYPSYTHLIPYINNIIQKMYYICNIGKLIIYFQVMLIIDIELQKGGGKFE